jgi:hypothetical protein
MRTAMLVLCLVALAAPSQAAQRTKPSKAPDDMATRAQMCRAIAGRELPEATDGSSHEGQLNVQRFSMCLMGKLPAIDCLLLQGLYEADLQALCR